MENKMQMEGVVSKIKPNLTCDVDISIDGGEIVTVEGYMAGRLKMHKIKLMVNDVVTIELSSYDLARGRVIHRHKK